MTSGRAGSVRWVTNLAFPKRCSAESDRAVGTLPAHARGKSIRKYRAGVAKERADHADAHNVLGLVLHAYEDACEMLAFVRDGDGDELREQEIRRVLETLATFGFADEYHYKLAVVGGVARPKLEGWILWLLGVTGTDAMTPARVDRELATTEIEAKSTAQYVAVAESSALPAGDGSLPEWLSCADATFNQLLDGEQPR